VHLEQPKIPGATAAQIERLQCHMLNASAVDLLANSCSICLCAFAEGDIMRSMPVRSRMDCSVRPCMHSVGLSCCRGLLC
jgi:hypothetical protein